MKKKFFTITLLFFTAIFLNYFQGQAISSTANVSLSAEVMASLAIMVDPASLSFGTLIAGNVSYSTGGVDIIVGTNSANGYQLAISDSQLDGDSSMLNQGDMSTLIGDYTALISNPQAYAPGDKGLGFTLYGADTNKEAKWGTGGTFNSINNNYAGIPQNATVFHSSPGYKDINDHSYMGFLLDVPGTQKTGVYSGDIVITATTVLE